LIREIIKNCNNRTGIGLAIVHAIILTVLILAKTPLPPPEPCPPKEFCFDAWNANHAGVSIIAGRTVHLEYEAPILQFLMIADIPGNLVGAVGMLIPWQLMKVVSLSKQTESYIAGINWIIFGSLQWWLIGTLIEIKLNRKI
jgi:hypothetical protein